MPDSTFVLLAPKKQNLTALQLMLQGDVEIDAPWISEPMIVHQHSCPNKDNGISTADNGKIGNLLLSICLEYPFWNDFRILDFLNKRGILMTLNELRNLRSECSIESREDVCLALMKLYLENEMQLNKKQIQFIERVNPAFRDRDFSAERPGELLVYECVFFRRLNKMFYLHLVYDLFNGYAFGRVSRRCAGEIGLKLLHEKVVPFYRGRGYTIKTLLHSIRATRDQHEAEEADIGNSILTLGIKWLEPKHEFGIIQRFQRDYLDEFFMEAEALDVSLLMIQPAFDRWIIKYNATCPFHQRRNLLGYADEFDSGASDWQSECN